MGQKRILSHIFSCKIYEISIAAFTEHLLVSASITLNKQKAVQNRTSKLNTAQKQSAGFVSVKVLL